MSVAATSIPAANDVMSGLESIQLAASLMGTAFADTLMSLCCCERHAMPGAM